MGYLGAILQNKGSLEGIDQTKTEDFTDSQGPGELYAAKIGANECNQTPVNTTEADIMKSNVRDISRTNVKPVVRLNLQKSIF